MATDVILKTDSPDATPTMLLQLAVQNNLDIDKLERLMALQERWQQREAEKDFLNAFSKFQHECPVLEKSKLVDYQNKAGGKTSYKFAPLGEIAEKIKSPMFNNGLSHRWELEETETHLYISCIVSHSSGHSKKTTLKGEKDNSGGKNAIQATGSTVTYLQRYSLIAALGLTTADEDNDGIGNNAKQATQPPQQNGNQPDKWLNKFKKDTQDITPEWTSAIASLLSGTPLSEIYSQYKVSKPLRAELEAIKPIPEEWLTMLEGCKTKADVDSLAIKNRSELEKNPDIKQLFQKHKALLKS